MSISARLDIETGKFADFVACDRCGKEKMGGADYASTLEALRQEGWKSVKESGGWKDFCPVCWEEHE